MSVNHAVLCYGWGEENGVKFWLIQNSWGKLWGLDGRIKIQRGINMLGIESNPEAFVPVVKED